MIIIFPINSRKSETVFNHYILALCALSSIVIQKKKKNLQKYTRNIED